MGLKRLTSALSLAAASALCVACESNATTCNEFFAVATPIMSSVTRPTGTQSSEESIAWVRNAAQQYELLAQEADKLAERTRPGDMKTALQSENRAASGVAKQLIVLADATTATDPSEINKAKSALEVAAGSERESTSYLTRQCSR